MRENPFRLLVLAAAMASVALPLSAVAAPKPWLPVGKWDFDTAADRCAAAQKYSAGDKDFVFGVSLTPVWSGGFLQFVAPGKFGGIKPEDVKVLIGQRRMQETAMVAASAKKDHTLYQIPVSGAELREIAAAGSVTVSALRFRAAVPVDGMEAVLATLDRCMSDMLARWGLPKEDQARLAKFPRPEKSLPNYVSSIDFPVSAENRGAVGAIEARLTIASDGTPSNCTIIRSSGHADLDAMTCKVALRPRYNPAIDRDGRSMASPFYFKITWTMDR